MEPQNIKKINPLIDTERMQSIIEEFFEKITLEVDVDVSFQTPSTLLVNIKTDEPQILIGQDGQTLFEIQHILRAILRKKTGEYFYLDLDINDYKKKKTDYLKETARSVADEVALTKKEQILEPMSAYERRVVHMELAGREDVISESTGEEPERKITIKPRS